ncbi:MAG TPA: ABC transporter permease, partial [Geminicoccaceae bacterium]|nr:ABC transporter permease [Geminicoccaceae bacterium]
MARFLKFVLRRLAFLVPQLFAVSVIVFFMVRLAPGDPSFILAGPYATPDRVEEVRAELGLDQPLATQYARYLGNVFRGDFGVSWRTSQPVMEDIRQRLPATLELVFGAALLSVLIGVPLGVVTAVWKGGVADRGVFLYGMLAGSLPDFWIALLLIFFLFYLGNLVPAPVGQLDFAVFPPDHVTGAYVVDAALTRNWPAFQSALGHLILPVLTLVLTYMPLVLKTARSAMDEMLESAFVLQARASGLSRWTQLRYALRNALPPVATVTGILVWFLLGGAVLVETIFAWGGLGQYAVESVVNSDYAPLQAFVLLAAVFTSVVFLLVDVAYYLLDPRIQ